MSSVKTLYLGFVREQGILIPAFITDDFEKAKKTAGRHIDDTLLPNNVVVVYKVELNTRLDKSIMTGIWTPEGVEVIVHKEGLSNINLEDTEITQKSAQALLKSLKSACEEMGMEDTEWWDTKWWDDAQAIIKKIHEEENG